MIALLAILVLGAASKSDDCARTKCGREARVGGRGSDSRGFSLATEYLFENPGTLPTCTAATNCLALCKVNAAGTAWECLDANGAAFGTVTQGVGTTFQDTPFGVKALSDVTSAKNPTIVSTALDALWKGDHTVVWGGYATTLTDANNQSFARMDDATSFFYVRNESGVLACTWAGAGGTRVANNGAVGIINGWGVGSCRRSGNNHIGRTNGSDTLTVAGASISGDMAPGTVFHFFDFNGSLPSRGPGAFMAFYSAAKSDAQLDAIEAAWWGVPTGTTSSVGTGVQCMEPDSGIADCYLAGSSIVTRYGIRTIKGAAASSLWAADPLLTTAGTDVGTPTITTSAIASPFLRWKPTSVCANMEDNDGAALEGKVGANGFTINTKYTASYYLAAGTSGTTTTKARIVVTTDGTGSTTCDFDDLTSTVTRKACTATVAGAATSVTSQILVGNDVADTGSITVCHRALNASGWAELPMIDNAAKGNAYVALDVSAWPAVSRGGKYEVVFTPVMNANSQWGTQADITYLFDVFDTGPEHQSVMLFGYQTAGRGMARTQNGADPNFTQLQADNITLTPGSMYAVSVEWLPDGPTTCAVRWRYDLCTGSVAACRASTLRASAGGGVCPSTPANGKLGDRLDASAPTSVNVAALRVYRK